jgi:tetratricopeptide (TPR) repeat protein
MVPSRGTPIGAGARIAAAALLSCGVAALAFGQNISRVAGTVKDAEGRAIKGATVTAVSPESPTASTASTDERGRFSILGLRSGEWRFLAQAPGFEPAWVAAAVRTLQNPPLDFTLAKASTIPPGALVGMEAKELQARIDEAEREAAAGRFDRAVAVYREVLERVPALTAVYLQIGYLYVRSGQPEKAADAYDALIAAAPDSPEAARAHKALQQLRK